jgi:hypothetical protein
MSEVLVSGRNCGLLSSNSVLIGDVGDITRYYSQKSIEAFTYATQCYQVPRPAGCDTFTQKTLPYTVNINASCPFTKDVCKSNANNLLLDSGDLDSFTHLGFNTGPRFLLRYRTHCAMLETEGFTDIYNDSHKSSTRFLRYNYGSIANQTFLYQVESDAKRSKAESAMQGDYKVT